MRGVGFSHDGLFLGLAVAILVTAIFLMPVRIRLEATCDLLDEPAAAFCVRLFFVKVFCGRLSVRDGVLCFVKRNGCAKPVKIEGLDFSPQSAAAHWGHGILSVLRPRRLSVSTVIGIAFDAEKTALTAAGLAAALDIARCLYSAYGGETALRLSVVPDFFGGGFAAKGAAAVVFSGVDILFVLIYACSHKIRMSIKKRLGRRQAHAKQKTV